MKYHHDLYFNLETSMWFLLKSCPPTLSTTVASIMHITYWFISNAILKLMYSYRMTFSKLCIYRIYTEYCFVSNGEKQAIPNTVQCIGTKL